MPNQELQNGVAGALAGLVTGGGRRVKDTPAPPAVQHVDKVVNTKVDTPAPASARLHAKKRAPERINVAYRIRADVQAQFLAWCDAHDYTKGEALEVAMLALMEAPNA